MLFLGRSKDLVPLKVRSIFTNIFISFLYLNVQNFIIVILMKNKIRFTSASPQDILKSLSKN